MERNSNKRIMYRLTEGRRGGGRGGRLTVLKEREREGKREWDEEGRVRAFRGHEDKEREEKGSKVGRSDCMKVKNERERS